MTRFALRLDPFCTGRNKIHNHYHLMTEIPLPRGMLYRHENDSIYIPEL